jgi:hypothetical protein
MPQSASDTSTRAKVMGLITACWSTQVIGVAVKLKLFDALAGGPRSSQELASVADLHAGALQRLMRALAALDLIRQTNKDCFELAEAGRLLCADAPGSVRGAALHWGDRLWGALSQLDQSVKTGKAWTISGQSGFEHMARDPQQMAMFHQSMADLTRPVARAVLDAYDFSGVSRIMDLGGSTGALLAAVVKANPHLTGRVFDLPGLEQMANTWLDAEGVADRASFVGGSFFEQVPSGAELIMMKMIIHDWLDEEAAAILSNTCKALPPGGVVLVMDRVASEVVRANAEDYAAARADITMLTAAGGKERTKAEFEELFARAGLSLQRIIPTASEFSILEGLVA